MEVTADFEVVEYNTIPQKNNTINTFFMGKQSVVINFCNKDEKVLQQSEISKEDAIKLAKLILHIYNN